jgi:hypothetical protein
MGTITKKEVFQSACVLMSGYLANPMASAAIMSLTYSGNEWDMQQVFQRFLWLAENVAISGGMTVIQEPNQ